MGETSPRPGPKGSVRDPSHRPHHCIDVRPRLALTYYFCASLLDFVTQRATTNCPGRNLGVPIPCPRERSLRIMGTTGRGLVATLLCIGHGKNQTTTHRPFHLVKKSRRVLRNKPPLNYQCLHTRPPPEGHVRTLAVTPEGNRGTTQRRTGEGAIYSCRGIRSGRRCDSGLIYESDADGLPPRPAPPRPGPLSLMQQPRHLRRRSRGLLMK